jgi:hypothetical protein
MTSRVPGAIGLLLAALTGAACSGDTTTSPTDVTSPLTVTWTTLLVPGGSASRSLTVEQSGTLSVTLQSAPVPVGLGVGVPQANGSGCRTTMSTTASAGSSPQLIAAVEQGTYCVLVFDVVGVSEPFAFTVAVVQP